MNAQGIVEQDASRVQEVGMYLSSAEISRLPENPELSQEEAGVWNHQALQ